LFNGLQALYVTKNHLLAITKDKIAPSLKHVNAVFAYENVKEKDVA
jgi:hypothetical protein